MSAVAMVVIVTASFALPSTASAAHTHGTAAKFQGYRSTGYLKGRGRYAIPDFTCPASGTSEHFFGIGWYTVAGTFAIDALVLDVRCTSGVRSLTARVQADDANVGPRQIVEFADAMPGDVVTAHFTYEPSTGVARITGHNLRTDERVAAHFRQTGLTFTSLLVGFDDSVSGINPMPAFDRLHFGGLFIDDQPATDAFDQVEIDDCYNGDARLVRTSLTPGGKGVNLTFVAPS